MFFKVALVLLAASANSQLVTAFAMESPSISATKPSFLSTIPEGPPDAILGIAEAFKSCTDERKVNVCVGAYRDSTGKPWILPSVRKAEERLLSDSSVNKEYAPIAGDAKYVELALKFAYGSNADLSSVAGVQSLSGTGACRIGGHFLSKFVPKPEGMAAVPIYIPNPTWGNHISIFRECGMDVRRYRYYDAKTNRLDYDGLMADLKEAPNGSVILLHACAHNPTGCDPTMDQWKSISDLIKTKSHHVFFDSAYQGFASGDAEADAAALRFFVSEGHNIVLAQSFAKNFGLYGERTGTLSVVCNSPEEKSAVMSQLKLIIRPMYSSPPIHGSSIVKTVLTDDALTTEYYANCKEMADRIRSMRVRLVEVLKDVGSTHDWSHVTSQIGMFAFTGMSSEMCDQLTSKYSIFLTRDGRISLAGLNEGNIEYVARAIHDVTVGKSITSS
jgi:aspartate aminotransferase